MSGSKNFLLAAAVDLVCCAFGGAILLFITAGAAVEEDETRQEESFIIVRLRQENKTGAELRIEWKAPGEEKWHWQKDKEDANVFSSPSAKGGGSAFVIIREPKRGTWSFRGYYFDYPSSQGKEASIGSTETRVRFEVYGKHQAVYLPEPETLKRPSSTTSQSQHLRIFVGE